MFSWNSFGDEVMDGRMGVILGMMEAVPGNLFTWLCQKILKERGKERGGGGGLKNWEICQRSLLADPDQSKEIHP